MHHEMAFDEADLHGFVDGRIEPSRAAALTASLASDPEAAARVAAWRRQTDSLRTMFTSVLCEPVPVRLLPIAVPFRDGRDLPAERSSSAAAPGTGSVQGSSAGSMRRLAGVVSTTAVGAALIGFALGALASLGTDEFGLAPRDPVLADGLAGGDRDLALRAAEAHRTFLADPSRPIDAGGGPPSGMAGNAAGGDVPKGARSVAHRIGAGLRIPELTRQGWTLLGGRIVPGRRGPAAFLTYGDGVDSLGLLVSRGGGDGVGTAARLVAADDAAGPLGVATWTDGEYGYALTSGRGRDWLVRRLASLRDAVRAQVRPADEAVRAP